MVPSSLLASSLLASPCGSRRLPLASLFAAVALSACGGGDSGTTPPVPSPPPPPLTAAQACAALPGTAIASSDISLPTTGAGVIDATLVEASGTGATAVGEYCRVTGSIFAVDKTAPAIQFSLALPTTWNGKAMHLMGGGYDGIVIQGSANAPGSNGFPTPLARGYAAFGSDSGHAGSPNEASFAINDEALENYLGDQLRKTRDVAVKLILKRYGSAPTRTYSAGGSGGGREALYVADRWPTLYDGVIAYYPAWSLTAMLTHYTAISKALAAPGAWSNQNKQRLLTSAVIAACDAADGAADGIVSHATPSTTSMPFATFIGESFAKYWVYQDARQSVHS